MLTDDDKHWISEQLKSPFPNLERLITDTKESLEREMQGVEREMREGFGRVEDAFTVESAISANHEDRLKDYREWLGSLQLSEQKHRKWLEEHDAAMRELDKKLDRIADLLLKGRGGNGKGGEEGGR